MTLMSNYANRSLITAPIESSGRQVARLMETYNIGAVVITKENEIYGLVTERDICRRFVGDGCDPDGPIAELVDRNVPRVSPSTTVTEASERMKESGVRYLFVLDEAGARIVGLASMQDLIRALLVAGRRETEALKEYIAGERVQAGELVA